MADEERKRGCLPRLVPDVDREELLSLLAALQSEEEDHLSRLRSMLYGIEAHRAGLGKWFRSIRRLVPAGYLH